jgi:hypothetical protein
MIISFSRLGKHGRLGNQLFQIASTMGLAEKHGARAVFPKWAYERFFETYIPHGQMQTRQVNEKFHHHHEWEIYQSSDLLGYMQSEKYFGSTKLRLRESFVRESKAKMPKLFEKKVICIQIRRGDYVGNEAYHQLTPNYFIDALLTHFPDWRTYNILFLSDDIEYCRTHFECMSNAFFSKNRDIVDLALASACDHFIISNSTFSWWCAWLGEKPQSKVICSGLLHKGSLAHLDPKDFYPDRWIRHQKDSFKIFLGDVTFNIPVSIEHTELKKNADLTFCLLQNSFDTNFIVCEQGGNQLQYLSRWAQYMREESPLFHRTKMLNDMVRGAKTPYIAQWNCNVIIPPMQLLIAVEELRNGADVVYPFDGRFARVDRSKWFSRIEHYLDIGVVEVNPLSRRLCSYNLVSAPVMYNKKSFMDGGMENEYINSLAPEDCERHGRFKKVGFNIRSISGTLFYMNQYMGWSSCMRHFFLRMNQKELAKIRKMSRDELIAYINSWPWRHPYTDSSYRKVREERYA